MSENDRMVWEIGYRPDEQIVLVVTRGVMTVAALRQMVGETIAEANARSVDKIIADHRLVTHDIAVADIYRLPDMLREEGVSARFRLATVFAVDSTQRRDFKFFDDRAYNTGLRHALFTDMEAARAWLIA